MRWIARIVTASVAVVAVALPIAGGTAQATNQPNSGNAIVLASCHYTVNGNDVAVRTAPDITAHVIKRKDRAAQVTGPCQDYYNGRWWTRVYLGTGGTGWMASAFLLYRGYW